MAQEEGVLKNVKKAFERKFLNVPISCHLKAASLSLDETHLETIREIVLNATKEKMLTDIKLWVLM